MSPLAGLTMVQVDIDNDRAVLLVSEIPWDNGSSAQFEYAIGVSGRTVHCADENVVHITKAAIFREYVLRGSYHRSTHPEGASCPQ
jgi:UDP-3-O-acyl-N-acetylglucosamine deacetylase